MAGYVVNIEEETKKNEYFRRVLYTAGNSQLVVMTLKPGEEIGMEKHDNLDQFIRLEEGEAKVVLDGKETAIEDDWAVVIPAGTWHNVVNTGKGPLQLYTIYSPPQHPHGTIHKTKTKAEADAAEAVEHQHAG